ncbi:MAG TPA: hypothetical protein VKS99_06665 [Blastocatellia bacterium]|nr:hypothetical protein [Blastocatellia bacterium]
MEVIEAWLLLTSDEQAVISSKLEERDGNIEETHREIFNRIIGDRSVEEIKNMVTLVKNFIDSMGGRTDGAIWRQIKSFEGVWLGQDSDRSRNDPRFHEGGGVVIIVNDRATFLDSLRKNGYAINTWYDKKYNKRAHPNDSARETTDTSWETGAHLANDDSRNLNLFFLHWDKRSTEFKQADKRYLTRLGEQRAAGRTHREPFTATQVREGLRRRGIAT